MGLSNQAQVSHPFSSVKLNLSSLFSQVEMEAHAEAEQPQQLPCTEVRRYAVVALTNLTFGNTSIKSFLCSYDGFIPIMVSQLSSTSSWSLKKATAHLFRNLAWKAEKSSKTTLSESNVVAVLMQAAMEVARASGSLAPEVVAASAEAGNSGSNTKEDPTLKVILSALWNLSAHCRKNKVRPRCVIESRSPEKRILLG